MLDGEISRKGSISSGLQNIKILSSMQNWPWKQSIREYQHTFDQTDQTIAFTNSVQGQLHLNSELSTLQDKS